MARAIEYNTEVEALGRSKTEATNKGCLGTTKYWWPVGESTVATWCVWIGNDTVSDALVERDPVE